MRAGTIGLCTLSQKGNMWTHTGKRAINKLHCDSHLGFIAIQNGNALNAILMQSDETVSNE